MAARNDGGRADGSPATAGSAESMAARLLDLDIPAELRGEVAVALAGLEAHARLLLRTPG